MRGPNSKGTVENAVQHTQSTALKGKRFETIEEQNTFPEQWETRWAAPRIHGSARRQVEAMFQEERAHLKPLPLGGFRYYTECERTVADDTYPRRLIDQACAQALRENIGSYKAIQQLTERLLSAALADIRWRATLFSARITHDAAWRAEKNSTHGFIAMLISLLVKSDVAFGNIFPTCLPTKTCCGEND